MTNNLKFNTLIIGAGNIGAFFDSPTSKEIFTHAHAFTKHKGFNFLGFVDINYEKAQRAAAVWGGKAFLNIDEAFRDNKIDVICIAVPDEFHYTILKKIAEFKIKLVFAEKPLAKSILETNEIARIYKKKKIPICVNYSRRFVPELEEIRNNIISGSYGSYLTGTGYYGKGILHNGSHLVDLLRCYVGEICDFYIVGKTYDFSSDDPSIAAILKFEGDKCFYLQNIDCKYFSIFEMDFIFEKRRIRIKDLGFKIEEFEIKESPLFKPYKNMVAVHQKDTSLGNALYFSAANIYDYLKEGKALKCSLEEGYKTMVTCIKILERCKKL